MAATPADAQAKLDKVLATLKNTKTSWPYMVRKYGSDWKKWPKTDNWYIALSTQVAARAEVGKLEAPTPPALKPKLTADFKAG